MQRQPLIIERVLGKRAIFVEERRSLFFQHLAPALPPFPCLLQFGKEQADCPQPSGFAQAVVVLLADGIRQVGCDALAGDGDHLGEGRETLIAGSRRIEKAIKAEAPGHNPESDLLPRLPVHALLWGIAALPTFHALPKRFDIAGIAAAPISSNQGERKAKPGRLPHDFDVAAREFIDAGSNAHRLAGAGRR